MKKILTDADGVLLNWEGAFHSWMEEKNFYKNNTNSYEIYDRYPGMAVDEAGRYVEEFNNCSRICCLPTIAGAVEGVAKLVNQGYRFDCITSISADPYTKLLRWQNLTEAFGSVFDELTCIGNGRSKDTALSKYKDTGYWWLEDLPKNCDAGLRVGLRPILISHPYNEYYSNPNVVRVKNWEELCEVILSE